MRLNITYLLLLPITPFLGWGPITHIHLHKKIADENSESAPSGLLESPGDKELFINAGNIADLIKANQLRYKERYYEYAHNTIPTKFEGVPVFGERLWTENTRDGVRERLIYSLGWLCHQVADQFPHRYPTNGFEGFVNARHFFGRYYPVDEEDWSPPSKTLRNDLISVDHWLGEIFADMLCLFDNPEFYRNWPLNLDFGGFPEVEAISAKIIDDCRDDLYPAVKYFIPLKPRILTRVHRYYHMVVRVFMDMYFHFYETLGPDGVRRMLDEFKLLNDVEHMMDYSIEAMKDIFAKPVGGWNPEKYKTPDPGPVRWSVYSYENYDGPERYDFGFRRGFIPWITGLFFNSQVLNELGKKVTDKVSTWGFVKAILEIAAKRRRSGVNITAYFITQMDASPKPSIEELIEKAGRRFRLKERGR